MDSYSEEDVIKLLKIANLDKFDLPAEVVRILYEDGIKTLYDLCNISYFELKYMLPGIGEARSRKITEFMSRYGLDFMRNGYEPYTNSLLFMNQRDSVKLFDYTKVDTNKIIEVLTNKE